MICKSCGSESEVGASFCGGCGAQLAVSGVSAVNRPSGPVGLGKAWLIWSAACLVIGILLAMARPDNPFEPNNNSGAVFVIWFLGAIALAFPRVRRLVTGAAETSSVAAKVAGAAIGHARIKAVVPDEPFFEVVAGEIAKGEVKAGLWAKAFSEAGGDKEKAKAAYIRLRVDQLRSAFATVAQEVRKGGPNT